MSLYNDLTRNLYAQRESLILAIAANIQVLITDSDVILPNTEERTLAECFNSIMPLTADADLAKDRIFELFTVVASIDKQLDAIERTLEGCV